MARRTRTRRTGARTRRPRTGKKSRGKLRRKRTRRPRISKRFFMRGGGGTLIINLSQKNAIINSGLKDASGKNIVVTIPPNNFHATIPTGDNPNYNMKINDKEIKFSVGNSERNIVIINRDGNITAEKDNDSEKYTIDKLINGDFENSNGDKLVPFYI